MAPLVQCLVGGGRPRDEQVAVQGHRVGSGTRGTRYSEAQQPAPQQAVAAPGAVPTRGSAEPAGREPEHRLLRHPEGADAGGLAAAAVHDEGVAGRLEAGRTTRDR